VSAVAVLRPDVLFIGPNFCDSISMSDVQKWSVHFKKAAVSSKFKFFIALVSLKEHPSRLSLSDRGYHWIVLIGDVAKNVSWAYDPICLTSAHDASLSILDKVIEFVSQSKRRFQRISCPEFSTQCQQKEAVHCGIWALFYTLHWCVDQNEYYQTICQQANATSTLPNLAVSLRQAIFSDLHRHPGFLDISFLRKRSSEVVTSRPVFWTLTPELNIASALQERCPGDCFKPSDKLSLHPTVRFFTSGRQFAKVYSFLWPIRSGDAALLASALHEAAATIAVCSKRPKWDYKVFGVVSQGAYASYVHICICRNVLLPQKVDSQAAIKKYMKLFRKTGIVHGDCHINNILKGANGAIEAFDFERCFIPLASVSNSTIENFITSFVEASSPDHLTSLLKSAKSYGLNRTRDYFTRLADACLSDPSNVSIPMLFTLDADALAQTFRGSTQ
jgi:hypothetical protein